MTMATEQVYPTDVMSDAPRRTYFGRKGVDGQWPGIIRVIEESKTGSVSRVLRGPTVTGSDDAGDAQFSWGYGGAGPSNTAKAILSDFLEAEATPALYQRFKLEFVAEWSPSDGWSLPDHVIDTWLGTTGIPKEHWTVTPL